jgi:multidrug efflux pump subunit AcrA (membrane-fusion protein)
MLIMKKLQNINQNYFQQQIKEIFKFSNFKISRIILIAILFGLYSCGAEKTEAVKKPKKTPPVKIQKVTASEMVSTIDITGTVQANIVTDVKSPADGIIETLYARENQYVRKDKLIAVINPTDRLSLISSSIEKRENLERKLQSAKDDSAAYLEIEKQLSKAKSDLEYARNMYQTIPVVCPMSGLITNRRLDKGSQVSEKDIILTITDMSSLVVKAEVNEKYFEAVKQGKKIEVILSAYLNDTLTGKISLVYPQIDASTRSVKFDIKLLDFKKTLLPGMMASIKIPVSTIENALWVPEHAVLTSPNNENFVFVIDKDSTAHRKTVQTGFVSGKKLQITQGIKEKDAVVISGQEMLKDSMKVKII